MTSKPDPQEPAAKGRDWGPPLAIAGLIVAILAVIAGFIAVGGPGDARDRRLDETTMDHVSNIAAAARCALTAESKIPNDLAGLRAAMDRAGTPNRAAMKCDLYGTMPLDGDVEYSRLADNRIRLCANFRRPYDPGDRRNNPFGYRGVRFAEFSAPRPAGRHCYELTLSAAPPDPAR
jgi:hypothetical protein